MGKWGFHLEGNLEGLDKETDEKLYGSSHEEEQNSFDEDKIKKILDEIDTDDIEDDYNDCGKEKEDVSKEEKDDDFSDCLKKDFNKSEKEILEDDIKDLEDAINTVEESREESEKLKNSIKEIFE